MNRRKIDERSFAGFVEANPYNLKRKTERSMEVHHPHMEHGKKKFREYFLEFLMIFLAVVLGFFAESTRESMSDRSKEKEYIESLCQNLRDDTLSQGFVISENQQKLEGLEKLMKLSSRDLSKAGDRHLLYEYCGGKSVGYYSLFRTNDATMLQLKSAGLRLLRKDHVADSIARYDNDVKIIYAAETLYNSATEMGVNATHEVLDYAVYYDSSYFQHGNFTGNPLPLLSEDPQKLRWLFNKVDFEIGATRNYINNLQLRPPFTIRLLKYLEKEYQLK